MHTASAFCVYFCFQIQLTAHLWCILIFVGFFWLVFSSFSFPSMCVLDELPSSGSQVQHKYGWALELDELWCPSSIPCGKIMWFFLSYESCSFECVSSLYHGYVANPNSIPLLFNLKIQFSVFNADVFISVVKIATTFYCWGGIGSLTNCQSRSVY